MSRYFKLTDEQKRIIFLKNTFYPSLAASGVLFFILLISLVVVFNNRPPKNFPINERIVIEKGSTLREISQQLEERGIIRSNNLFNIAIIFKFGDQYVRAGTYLFPGPLTLVEVTNAVAEGFYGIPLLNVTIPEGLRTDQIDDLVAKFLPNSSIGDFIAVADGLEGKLFPDTYFIPETYDAEDMVKLMNETFNEKIKPFKETIEDSQFTLDEVLTFASIIEREAGRGDSKRLVSGVLHNRLAINMPLQVDATFEYFLGKSSADLTFNDLKKESPYNTYLNKGLPPGPIANPGLESIQAVLNPIDTQYFFYLTGSDGVFYYAETFEQHKINKALYLP